MDGKFHIPTQAEMLERGIKAAARYLEHCGEQVLDMAFECAPGRIDLVSRDADGTIRIVFVRVRQYVLPEMLVVDDELRRVLETRAAFWLEAHRDEVDCAVTFDVADLAIIGTDRAMMRVQRDILQGMRVDGRDLLARAELRSTPVPGDAVEVDVCDDDPSEEDSGE